MSQRLRGTTEKRFARSGFGTVVGLPAVLCLVRSGEYLPVQTMKKQGLPPSVLSFGRDLATDIGFGLLAAACRAEHLYQELALG